MTNCWKRHVVLSLSALLFTVAAARADCENTIKFQSICDNCRVIGQLNVVRDQPCYRTPEFSAREPIAFLSARIAQRASHGVAGTSGVVMAYTPTKGYTGPDEFEVEMTFQQGAQTGKYRVHWNVTVK